MTDHCDVLVIGSGAAGLSTAVTAAFHGLKVILIEKHHQFGGTTAWSGGWLWIPRNPLAVEAGIVEDMDGPLEYLRSEIGNRIDDPRIRVFLENGPEMVRFFRDHTAVDWTDGNRMPDFHDSPGSREGGRSVCAAPYDGRALGAWIARMREPLDVASLWGMGIAAGADMTHFFNAKRNLRSAMHAAGRVSRHLRDRLTHGRGMQLVNGNALVARLLRSALDLGVDLRSDLAAIELTSEKGRVTGVRTASGDILASRGVVLACGGFPHGTARIAQMFEHAPNGTGHHSAAPPENTGDGLALAEAAGGRVADDLTDPGAWAPVSLVPTRNGTARFPHLVDRAKPGFIVVGPDGKRLVNEANSYHDIMRAIFAAHPDEPHAWVIGDAKAVGQFGIGAAKPAPFRKSPFLRSGYLKRGATPAELAQKIGMPADALTQTLTTFNSNAARGEDPAYGRGTTPYNRALGDAAQSPNPSLRPLTHPPFYAVKLVPGSLGTFAGLKTDGQARVLGADNQPIPGLFAAGNDAASIFGGNYPSGGITLGPAMTFGYIAGRTLANQPITGLDQTQEKTI